MRINLAFWDRLLRFFFGTLLTAWAIAGGPWWGFFGIYLLVTAGYGMCPVYAILKIRSAPNEQKRMVPPE